MNKILLLIIKVLLFGAMNTIATPRIYYHKEKLYGNPLQSKIITLEAFDYILANAGTDTYKILERYKLVLVNGDFDSVEIEQFKYCTIRKRALLSGY